MEILLLIFLIFLFAFQNVGFKIFSSRYLKNVIGGFAYNTIVCSFIAILFLVVSLPISKVSWQTILLASLFGLAYPICILFTSMAFSNGSMAYTTLLVSSSLIIPTLFGCIFLKEPFSLLQTAGVILLVVSFCIGNINFSSRIKNLFTIKWFLLALVAAVSNGMLGIFQKVHTIALSGEDTLKFFAVGFSVSAIFMWAFTIFNSKINHSTPYREMVAKGISKQLLLALFIAICGGAGNLLTMLLAGRMNANILFPVANGGILIASSIFAIIFFKERLNMRQIIGIILGAASILLISNIF